MESRRDIIKMGEVEYIYGNSSFTELTVIKLLREADCTMKYGNLDIGNVVPEFSRISIKSEYTDIDLNLAKATRTYLDIMHHDRTVVTLPEKNTTLKRKFVGTDMVSIEGNIGAAESGKRITLIARQKCYINISNREVVSNFIK